MITLNIKFLLWGMGKQIPQSYLRSMVLKLLSPSIHDHIIYSSQYLEISSSIDIPIPIDEEDKKAGRVNRNHLSLKVVIRMKSKNADDGEIYIESKSHEGKSVYVLVGFFVEIDRAFYSNKYLFITE